MVALPLHHRQPHQRLRARDEHASGFKEYLSSSETAASAMPEPQGKARIVACLLQ